MSWVSWTSLRLRYFYILTNVLVYIISFFFGFNYWGSAIVTVNSSLLIVFLLQGSSLLGSIPDNHMILSYIAVKVALHQSTTDEFFDQFSNICNVFAIHLPALNRAMKLNKNWRCLTIVYFLLEFHLVVPLCFSVVICLSLIDNHRKCWNKILEIIEFIYNLTSTPLVFLNLL